MELWFFNTLYNLLMGSGTPESENRVEKPSGAL